MKSKVKKILLRILLVIGIIIAVILIWLLCNYKYLTTLTRSYDHWGSEEPDYESYVNSGAMAQVEDAEEVVIYLKGTVTRGEVTISYYRVSDDVNYSGAWAFMDYGPSADEDAILLYTGTFKAGDTFDVEKSLGPQKRGYYVYLVEQTDDLEIQIWENINTYNRGRVHEKYKLLNKLRRWGWLKDREASI